MKKSFIADMTWEEFRDQIDDAAVVVIPMGSTELEGSHLPLGVDTIMAKGLAGRLEGEKGVLIGPTLPIGYSKWFLPFPGTISLEADTLARVLVEYCISLISHGIRRIVFLNSHRGNNACIETTARTLIGTHHVRMGMLSVWKLANDLAASNKQLFEEGRFTHAGEIMTSAIMALQPGSVVTDRIQADSLQSPPDSPFRVKNSLGETGYNGSVQIVYQDICEITTTGIMGDPTSASTEKGEALLDLLTDYTKSFLQDFRKLPVPQKAKPSA